MKNTDRLLNILSYISSSDRPVFPKSIAEDLKIPLSTVYRNLNILMLWEFIALSKRYGAYTLGAQSLKGKTLHQKYSLFGEEVDQVLSDLAKKTGESAAIVVADYYETICITMAESHQALRCSFVPGRVNRLIYGASGKTLLAHKAPEIRDMIIDLSLPDTGLDHIAFIQELDLIKSRGYGRTMGEIDPGVLGISAPIKRNQNTIAVVTLMAPFFRSEHKEQQWIEDVLEASQEISALINID